MNGHTSLDKLGILLWSYTLTMRPICAQKPRNNTEFHVVVRTGTRTVQHRIARLVYVQYNDEEKLFNN